MADLKQYAFHTNNPNQWSWVRDMLERMEISIASVSTKPNDFNGKVWYFVSERTYSEIRDRMHDAIVNSDYGVDLQVCYDTLGLEQPSEDPEPQMAHQRFLNIKNHRMDPMNVIVHIDFNDRLVYPLIDQSILTLLDKMKLPENNRVHIPSSGEGVRVDVAIILEDELESAPRDDIEILGELTAKKLGEAAGVQTDNQQHFLFATLSADGRLYRVGVDLTIVDYDCGEDEIKGFSHYVRQVEARVYLNGDD